MRSLKVTNAIACEYIAAGPHGKHTLVNVFSGDIAVLSFPAKIRIAVYLELEVLEGQPEQMKFEFIGIDKILATIDSELPGLYPGITAVLVFPVFELGTEEPIELNLIGSCKGFKRTTMFRKAITLATPDMLTTALPLPSEQSRLDAPAS